MPPFPPQYASQMAPMQLVDNVDKMLARDAIRLRGLNYPQYRGPSVSPMSSLTQRSRELQQKFGAKPAPYARKIQNVLSRNPQGLGMGGVDSQINNLRSAQNNFTQNRILSPLQNQFKEGYAGREGNFLGRANRATERGLGEARMGLGDINTNLSNLDRKRNELTAQTLTSMQGQKQIRRNQLVGNLTQFGDQKHAYNNLKIGAERNQFDAESTNPQKRLRLLMEANERARGLSADGSHPDLAKAEAQNLIQGLRAYGVDPNLPVDQWEAKKTTSKYPGELVAPLNAEITTSQSLLERLNPNLKDNYADERKSLRRDLVGNASIAQRTLDNVPERLRPQISALESDAKKRLKRDLAGLNNQYIKLGQYGSEQHMGAAERRAKEIDKATFEQRNRYLQDGLKNEAANSFADEAGKIKKLGMLSDAGHNEFGNVIGDIRNQNQLGTTKWRNDQSQTEEAYKNYQNEKMWEWPLQRNQVRREANNEIFQGIGERDINLDRLSQLNTRYSEMERELADSRGRIDTERDYWRNKYDTYSAEQNRIRAEQERRAAEERSRAERERAEREARERAERDRLAAIPKDDPNSAAYGNEFQSLLGELSKRGYYLPGNGNRPANFGWLPTTKAKVERAREMLATPNPYQGLKIYRNGT